MSAVVLRILILPPQGLDGPFEPSKALSLPWHRTRRVRRRTGTPAAVPRGRVLCSLLVRHWTPLALRTRPEPRAQALQPRLRANVAGHDLLRQCEALLRQLLRRRLRWLGLRQGDLAAIALGFDVQRQRHVGSGAGLAFLLAAMYWRGCSIPAFLFGPPLHPPTGLVRWLSTYSVTDQVDQGVQVLEHLVDEESRIFEHATVVIEAMQRMKSLRGRPGVALLPALLDARTEVQNQSKRQSYYVRAHIHQ